MSNDKNNGLGNFMTGIVVGSIVGAATALFLAPKSGKELRSDLNDQVEAIKEKSGEWKVTVMEKGSEITSTAKEKTDQFRQVAMEKGSQVVEAVKEKADQFRDKAKETTSEIVETTEELAEDVATATAAATSAAATLTEEAKTNDELVQQS